MKRNRILNVVLILFAAAVISCKEHVALEYENDPALYFVWEEYGQKGAIAQSFATLKGEPERDTVWVEVKTMGFLSDVDRPVRFKQTNVYHADTAKYVARPGIHYVPFDDLELLKLYYVPANKARTKIPVVVLRDKTLDTMRVHLMLTIEENEYFRKGISTMVDFEITMTSAFDKPRLWDDYWGLYAFGDWGAVKMKFVAERAGIDDWDAEHDLGYYEFLKGFMKDELAKYNAAHPDAPLAEADGTLVKF